MRLFVNFLHAMVGVAIVLILWVGSAQGYVRLFGVDNMAIVVAATGMVVGVFTALVYYMRFSR